MLLLLLLLVLPLVLLQQLVLTPLLLQFMNAGNAYSTYWAPVINLVRDPRWGRNIETPGEDVRAAAGAAASAAAGAAADPFASAAPLPQPYLSGQYAINFVKGMQDNPADPGHVMASACCKHYIANSMDSSTVDGHKATRTDFNAVVNQQDMIDS